MSDAGAADEWDVVVPENGEQLLAELRRHGVKLGQRLHVRSAVSGRYVSKSSAVSGRYVSKGSGGRRSDDVPAASDEALPDFIGSFDSGQPDLAERSQQILRADFPDR